MVFTVDKLAGRLFHSLIADGKQEYYFRKDCVKASLPDPRDPSSMQGAGDRTLYLR